MTEEEAIKKWCPFAIQTITGPASYNRFGDPKNVNVIPIGCMCLASKCMVWKPTSPQMGIPAGGHCGLAGRIAVIGGK
jgi:hypothetical protein